MRLDDRHRDRARRSTSARWLLAGAALALGVTANADVDHAIFWAERDDANAETIDHAPWQGILDGYLRTDHPSGVNRFDYAALQASTEHSQSLTDYLASLQALDPRRYSGAEQKAYWINFYNALTARLVTDAYPVDSIRDMGENWLIPGPWGDVHAKVAGVELTLDDMEHEILRPIWQDNRIHYGVNCASIGCPNLNAQAYTAANTEQLLDEGARAYVNHPRGVTVQGRDLLTSSIYDWFQEDFQDSEEGVLEHLRQYAAPELRERLSTFRGDLEYEYDWSLNAP